MPVILYKDANYEGAYLRLQPGFYAGQRDLEGATQGSSYGEPLNREVSSIRVDDGYIAVLYGTVSESATGGARTLIGPTEVPDLGAVGMDDKTSAIKVLLYEQWKAAVPRDFGVTLYSSPYKSGSRVEIGQGDFDRARLDSPEVNLGSNRIQSVCAGSDTIVVLYEGNNFESTMNSIVVTPGGCIEDVATAGMTDSAGHPVVGSIRVLYAASKAGMDPARPGVAAGISATERAYATLGSSVTNWGVPGGYVVRPYVNGLSDFRDTDNKDLNSAGGDPNAPGESQSGSSLRTSHQLGQKEPNSGGGQQETVCGQVCKVLIILLLLLVALVLGTYMEMHIPARGYPATTRTS